MRDVAGDRNGCCAGAGSAQPLSAEQQTLQAQQHTSVEKPAVQNAYLSWMTRRCWLSSQFILKCLLIFKRRFLC